MKNWECPAGMQQELAQLGNPLENLQCALLACVAPSVVPLQPVQHPGALQALRDAMPQAQLLAMPPETLLEQAAPPLLGLHPLFLVTLLRDLPQELPRVRCCVSPPV